ncbi:MAG: DUF983 domain-containing protein [Flavobacteriales bacterium]|nr:DUF983 domain-containing protein [Flavobacteriales bacterium]|tara:strand:- start:83 stop:469 length:387 start_codon:yes stop_codon:yes gene_type:complete
MFRLIKKGNKLYSIIYNYCPRCQTEKFWPENNPYKNIFVNNRGDIGSCKNCNLKYEIEPGFWYGAMYVSYGLTVFIATLVWLIINAFNKDIDIFFQIFIISFSLIFLLPVVYFLSRLIWINLFVSYNK